MSGTVGECAVCGTRDVAAKLRVPPRALQLMRHGKAIPWEDVGEPATVGFCASDWRLVSSVVLDDGQNPLPQCNARYVEYESETSHEIQQLDLEAAMWRESQSILEPEGQRGEPSRRSLVEARIVAWSLDTLIDSQP